MASPAALRAAEARKSAAAKKSAAAAAAKAKKVGGGGPPSKEALRKAGANFARKTIDKIFEKSTIEDHTRDYPQFDSEEVKLGKVLGKGGFGTVYEITGFNMKEEVKKVRRELSANKFKSMRSMRKIEDDEVAEGQMESRKFIAEHCIRNGGDARYALKLLSKEVVEDPARFLQGMIDMAVETRILSDIEHPNIVKMRALSRADPYSEQYFIAMDRLFDTLEGRIKKWDSRSAFTKGFGRRLSDPKGLKAAALYEERIVYAFDLAAAFAFLHRRKLIYRDIKPENIGFDIRDDIKVFDFGLSKELCADARNKDGTYNLTEMTGSPRYMAPEVANGSPYNETCDCYSFAILLWEMLMLKRPYELYTPKLLRERVYNGQHKRPPVDESWCTQIKLLLKRSWSKDPKERNSMGQIQAILRKESVICRGGDETGLEHNSRRSTFVMRSGELRKSRGGNHNSSVRSLGPPPSRENTEKTISTQASSSSVHGTRTVSSKTGATNPVNAKTAIDQPTAKAIKFVEPENDPTESDDDEQAC